MNVVREYRRRGALELRAQAKLGLPTDTQTADEEDADARLSAAHDFLALRAPFSELPNEQRSALELRVVEELEYSEIGVRQGVAASTARTRVHRALRRLKFAMNGAEK